MSYCSECTYLKVDGEQNYGKFWCEYRDWVYANQIECSNFCRAYSRASEVSDSAYEYSKNSQSSGGCYITTALCKILSMDDDNPYLNTLRGFRDNYLQENKEGLKILAKYDIVGPKISSYLQNDNGRFNMAYILFNNFIVKVVEAINKENYDEAITLYTDMTNRLIAFYKIDDTINVNIDEIEPSLAGHGILRKKCMS